MFLEFSFLVLQCVNEHLVGRNGCCLLWIAVTASDNQWWMLHASVNQFVQSIEVKTARIWRKTQQGFCPTWQCSPAWGKTSLRNSRRTSLGYFGPPTAFTRYCFFRFLVVQLSMESANFRELFTVQYFYRNQKSIWWLDCIKTTIHFIQCIILLLIDRWYEHCIVVLKV